MSLHVSYIKPTPVSDDVELWACLKAGDRDAFTKIYYNNAKALLIYALKMTSDKRLIEDCIQELFLDLWRNRTSLSDVSTIRNYLFTAIRRRLIRALKPKNILFSTVEVENSQEFELSLEGSLMIQEENREKKEKLQKTLKYLSPLQKEIIYLKYYNNFSFEEIAGILETNKKTVYNALSKAMIKLRKILASSMLVFLWF